MCSLQPCEISVSVKEVFVTDEIGKDGMPKKVILKTDYEVPEYIKETLDDYVLIRLPENA